MCQPLQARESGKANQRVYEGETEGGTVAKVAMTYWDCFGLEELQVDLCLRRQTSNVGVALFTSGAI